MQIEPAQAAFIVDLIIAYLLAETAIIVYRQRPDERLFFGFLSAASALAGIGLLLALRAAVMNAHEMWIAASLALAFFAHIAELRYRHRLHVPGKNS
ncbi:MAG TPA: hypothetical protein VF389_10700 [Woeseiaceae bacterium]